MVGMLNFHCCDSALTWSYDYEMQTCHRAEHAQCRRDKEWDEEKKGGAERGNPWWKWRFVVVRLLSFAELMLYILSHMIFYNERPPVTRHSWWWLARVDSELFGDAGCKTTCWTGAWCSWAEHLGLSGFFLSVLEVGCLCSLAVKQWDRSSGLCSSGR